MISRRHWQQFESKCAKDFGGNGRFPANVGGPLDFSTSFAVGQCKLLNAKHASITPIALLTHELDQYVQAHDEHKHKWPIVACRVKRGHGVKAETLFCLSVRAAEEWIGTAPQIYGEYSIKRHGKSLDSLTEAVELFYRVKPEWIGLKVLGGAYDFIVVSRSRFLENYCFKPEALSA